MKTVSLSARFDGEHIRLEEFYPLRTNARLLVTVLPDEPTAEAALREEWHRVADATLNGAYAPNEPEYSTGMVREPTATMEAGDVILASLTQADGQVKLRPALLLCRLPPYGDWLLCGASVGAASVPTPEA